VGEGESVELDDMVESVELFELDVSVELFELDVSVELFEFDEAPVELDEFVVLVEMVELF